MKKKKIKKVKKPLLIKSTAVEVLEKVEKPEAEVLVEEARRHFGQMQRSWFGFAKAVARIKETESFKLTSETFKEFCDKEFPTVNFATIVKFISVTESWGEAIDSRLKKDPHYVLPAYESFYSLTTVESKVSKEELSKLRKAVLDSKLSYHGLREKIKELAGDYRKKIREEVDSATDKIEQELLDDLREEDLDLSEEIVDEIDEDEGEDATQDSVLSCISRVEYLKENLPELRKQVKKSKSVSDEVSELAKELEALGEVVKGFLKIVKENE